MKLKNNIELDGNQLIEARAEVVSDFPNTKLVEGRIIYHATNKKYYYYNGTEWKDYAGDGSAVSPTISVLENTDTSYVLNITDKDGTITTPNLKGANGTNGTNGTNGVSPTISVATNTSSTYTLSITDKNGTFTTPNLKGADGSSSTNTDYKVQNSTTSNDSEYPIILLSSAYGGTATNTTTTSSTYRTNNVYVNPSTATVTANKFVGSLSGNATSATTATSATSATKANEATFARSCYQISHTPESGYTGEEFYISNGDDSTPIYLKNGTFWTCTSVAASTATTASKLGSDTIGSTTLPIYLKSGTPTACSTSLGVSITGNAATATKVGTSTVGSSTQPIYLSSGTPTACGSSLAVSITGTAAKATADGSGNTITSTYATQSALSGYLPLSGGTMSGNIRFGSTDYYFSTAGKVYASDVVVKGTYVAPSGTGKTCGTSSLKWASVHTAKVNSTAADYAEYFEWEDGNPDDEDRRGLFVTLTDGEKISLSANEDDDFLGIISADPAIICDDTSDAWIGKYKKDVFGVLILDEDGNQIISEDYDESQEYIPRSERSEWDMVGLLGKIIMVDDGTCVPNKYCKPCSDGSGRATVSDTVTRCRCMKRVDDTHIKVFIR